MMGTKFASYTLKLASLHEYYQRILHGNQPIPSGIDIANTLKYFLQSLLTLLKDVEKSPYEMLKFQKQDLERMTLYPNLDYKQLYNALSQLIDVLPAVQSGLNVLGRVLLQCIACLLPFLEHDLIESISYLSASTIAVLPRDLHQDIINYLCYYILPFTLRRKSEDDTENYASQSISAVIMMIFEYSNNSAQHCQLLECLLALKTDVVKDMLCVVAYGTSSARLSATKLIFHYWPAFNSNFFDHKSHFLKFPNEINPFVCQRDNCPNAGSAEAAKVCYHHSISITFATDCPPPLYLCIECANEIHRDNPNLMFYDILHPMQHTSVTCENKNCRSIDKSTISICFSTECASYNSNHPIRYCLQCHNTRHNDTRGGDHIYHIALTHISQMNSQLQAYTVQAITSLLKEAESSSVKNSKDSSELHVIKGISLRTTEYNSEGFTEISESAVAEERQLLARFGVWLLISLCAPEEDICPKILGRLLSILFHWFHATAYSFDGTKKSLVHLIFSVGQTESSLEKLKTDYVCPWLSRIMERYNDILVSCLLPYPSDYVRAGGYWETFTSRTLQLKDGLNRLFCLIPYDIISSKIWNYVMPYWMQAVFNDVPANELQDIKIILCKILDPDMSPLGFDSKEMYSFISKRFNTTDAKVQEQALNWLQTLTMLGITLPLSLLFSIFYEGISVNEEDCKLNKNVNSTQFYYIKNVNDCHANDDSETSTMVSDNNVSANHGDKIITDEEAKLSCYILMLDIILKQMELQNIEKNTGMNSVVCKDACRLLKSINIVNWSIHHKCINKPDCLFCESIIIWHQLSLQLLAYVTPKKYAHTTDILQEEFLEGPEKKSPSNGAKKCETKSDTVMNMPIPDLHSVGGVLVHMPHFFEQIMTATVETVSEQLDLPSIMPAEKVVSAVARSVTHLEAEKATATHNVRKQSATDDNRDFAEESECLENFWETSIGKFCFSIEELPEQLQYIYKLFKELILVKKSDILCYMIECLNRMCLFGDILNFALKDHQGFFIWCQENLIIKNLWIMLSAEHSHIAQIAVPLLLHCITLPSGVETFWEIIKAEFHCDDWRIRFTAVEKTTLIARFVDSTPLKKAFPLQATLANIFCYLINSTDDNNVYVAQKATLYLGTIHDSAIKTLLICIETQFDAIIVDRPLILQSLYHLHNCICDRRILTWEFFLNRFDTLYIEAQIVLERTEGITCFRDLRNSDQNNETFMKRLQKAHEALLQFNSNECSTKTVNTNLSIKGPYKRTLSAPASTMLKTDSKQDKDKICSRQYSAPLLKRKSSKFGLGQLIGYTLPSNSLTDVNISSLNMADDGNRLSTTQKIVELEVTDKETIHLLVFLLMQFLSRSDQVCLSDDKTILKLQGYVLQHLYLLLGYNQIEKYFYMPPDKLRLSPVFNVFLTNLPQVLDQNHNMSIFMIQSFLIILQNSPCPAYEPLLNENITPTFSLWYLEISCRRSWLMALLVILYKYEYKQEHWCQTLQFLMKIILHTLDRQYHKCKYFPTNMIISSLTSKTKEYGSSGLATNDTAQNILYTSLNILGQPDTFEPPLVNIQDHFLRDAEHKSILHIASDRATDSYSDKHSVNKVFDWTTKLISHETFIDLDLQPVTESRYEVPISLPVIERLLPVGSHIKSSDQEHKKNRDTFIYNYFIDYQKLEEIQMPLPERLLPVGLQKYKSHTGLKNTSQIIGSFDESEEIGSVHNEMRFCTEEEAQKNAHLLPSPSVLKSSVRTSTTGRKLIKQIALESPAIFAEDNDIKPIESVSKVIEDKYYYRCHKDTFYNAESQPRQHNKKIQIGYGDPTSQSINSTNQRIFNADFLLKQNLFRVGDETNCMRCTECGLLKEEYLDEELGLCIIILGTFIHREPYLAAPLLPAILNTVTNVSLNIMFPWQNESSIYLPGGATSVAHQFLRCVLHRMTPNGIFTQMFFTNIKGTSGMRFFKSIAQSLIDFNELNPIAPLQILLENLNGNKSFPIENLTTILHNIACYLSCLPIEAGLGPGATTWSGLIFQFETLFRKLVLVMSNITSINSLFKIMICLLKVPGIQQSKTMLDPFSKILGFAVQNTKINFNYLIELSYLCHRNFTRDRDKHLLSRIIVFELVKAIKFKTNLPDVNLLLLLQFVLQDVGGLLLSTIDIRELYSSNYSIYNTNASDSLKNQMTDIIDFLTDVNSSIKFKSYTLGLQRGFNDDTLSGEFKCGLAQYLALEITKGNNRENRTIVRYLPWLYSSPSIVLQGAREFSECVSHIRLLCWLFLGSLTHSTVSIRNNFSHLHGLPLPYSQPILQESSCHIADHIIVLLSSFPDQYKTTSINISSMYYVFNLCQLWTLYLEDYSKNNTNNESQYTTTNILLEFWGKITPCILQLIQHSKNLADIVNHHFLNLLESFLDCHCSLLSKVIPMWNLIISSPNIQIPNYMHSRLQYYNIMPSVVEAGNQNIYDEESNVPLLHWLRKIQFKMGQIELQSANTIQFYMI